MLKEFKAFIAQGNVLDLAVGVVIGAAFGKITTSLVDDILMPIVGLCLGGIDFKTWKIVLKEADTLANKPELTLNIGNFIQTTINFLIIAWIIFLVVKAANKAKLTEK